MEPEEEAGSAGQNQNLHDLQNYLVTFKNEIESSDDVLPSIDVDGGDVNDLYSGSGNHLQDPGDGEVSGQFSSGFYSEQGMLGTTLTDDSPQQQMQNLVSSTEAEVDSEISSAKDGVSGIDLERVQAQIAGYGDSQLSQAIPGMQGGSAHQGIIMTSLGDGLDPNNGKMIQIVSLGGEEGQYLSLADGQQMQILNSEDLGLTSESLEQIDNSVDLNSVSSTVTALNNPNPQMALVSLPGSEMPSSSINIMAPDNKDVSTGQIAAAVGDGASLFNSGLASLVALPSSMEGAQHQLFALHRPGIGPEPLQMTSLLGGEGIASQDLGCQTITIVPSDMSQNGEMNYVLILSQPDGTKDGVASMAQICDFKQETTEITDTIVDHNGETKNVLRLVPKKLVGEMSNQQLVCDYCNYTSPKRYLLTRHMKSHSEERPFKCEACSRGFKTAASLLNHVNTHTGTRPHKCKTCAAAFTTSGELVRHIRYRHTFEKPHRCPECDYASVELSKLKRHMRSHTGERPYKCPSCPYASPDTYKLKRHMRIHTGEKPYECDICHARFTQSNSLKAHKLIHTGNKPIYQCSLCPTTCGRKTDLKIHFNKLHAIGSPLDCKKCGKAFSDRYSYKQHVRSHDMDKCFKCDHCDFMAATEKNLELHMSVHGRKYECDECHLSFILKHLLDKHKAMFHGNAMAKEVNATDAGKSKDESDSGFVTVLGRYDLSDLQSESEESAHIMLSTPSASDTLHKNLMQDIKEGKLGDVPQVVIVHPDGSQEEISSKLTGDKWSIEELFSTATNNGQTGRYDDPDREMEENKDKEPDLSLPASDDASAASHLADSLLQTTVVEGQGSMMIVPEEEGHGQDSCFTHTEVSQLCEASTQAEIESDTDSSGETPDQEVLNGSHAMQQSTGKLSKEVEGTLQQSLKLGTCTGKTSSSPSSSSPSSSSCTAFNQTNPLEMSSVEPTVSSFPTSYLKSLIQKPLVVMPPSSSSLLSSSSSPSSLSSLSSTKKLTSVLQFPKTLLSTSNTSVKTNSSGQQYSLLKNLNLSSGSLMAASDSGQMAKAGKDSVVKLFVNFGSSGSDNSSSNMKDNLSDPSSNLSGVMDPRPSSPSPLPTNDNPTSVSTLSAATGANEIEAQESNLYFDISKDTPLPAVSEASSSATQASNEIDISSQNADAVSTNVSTQVTASLSLCDNELSPPSTWSSLAPAVTTNTITAQVSSMIESHGDEKLNPEFTIFEPILQKDNLAPILSLNSCDSDGDDKKSLSISTSESGILSVAMDQASTTEQFPEQNLNKDVIPVNLTDPASLVGCPKSSSNDKGNAASRRGKVDSVVKGVDVVTPAAKKSKPVKRHSNMDQSLVMQGKRVRKALVKVSL